MHDPVLPTQLINAIYDYVNPKTITKSLNYQSIACGSLLKYYKAYMPPTSCHHNNTYSLL